MQSELDFDEPDDRDGSTTHPIEWIARTYESATEWKARAKVIFCSVNGDSRVARNRVAALLRAYFSTQTLMPEEIRRWTASGIEMIQVSPPRVSPSIATYIDWLHIADFLLLPCASVTDEVDAENKLRDTEFQNALRSFEARIAVEIARTAIIRAPHASDREILDSIVNVHPRASMTTISHARKSVKSGRTVPIPRKPERSQTPMPRYVPLYFVKDSVTGHTVLAQDNASP